jgi:hypothetical protein
MRGSFARTRLSTLVVLACALAVRVTARADSIKLVNGKVLNDIEVVLAQWDNVQYRRLEASKGSRKKSKPTSLAGQKIRSMVRESYLLQPMRDAIVNGKYKKALEGLKAIGEAGSGKTEPWELAEARYLIGKTSALAGEPTEAGTAFKDYLSKHDAEKDWYLPFAVYEYGEALIAAKKPGTAVVHFKRLAEFGGRWPLLAKYGEGLAALAKGKAGAQAARSLLEVVSRSREAPLELREKAAVARVKAILVQENAKRAIEELNEAFFDPSKGDKASYSATRAEATLLMGQAYQSLGGKENLQEAELWFLRIPALYRRHSAIYDEACRALADVYGKLGNKKREEEWKARLAATTDTSSSRSRTERGKAQRKNNGSANKIAAGGSK